MANLKEDGFYRYITRRGAGWQLRKNGEHYGWYDRIEDALFDRDRLEQCDWDFSIFCELPEIPNPYEHMELPSYEERKSTFIQRLPQRWRVQKRIDGKMCYFGTYKTFEEAEERRNDLIKNGWF
ncbi:hypothetical protein [Methanobrevibacter sp.]